MPFTVLNQDQKIKSVIIQPIYEDEVQTGRFNVEVLIKTSKQTDRLHFATSFTIKLGDCEFTCVPQMNSLFVSRYKITGEYTFQEAVAIMHALIGT